MNNFINKHIKIKDNTISINGVTDFVGESSEFKVFAKAAYKNYGLKYGKYFKMDKLSKLGFIASELLLQDLEKEYKPEEVAVIFANASSSLNTDANYQETLKDVPSPSVFVYTLPNIVIGEICIRNGFKGESMFLVQDEFDTDFTTNYVDNIFETTNTKLCIMGWVEMSQSDEYQADLFLVSKEQSDIEFNNINVNTSFRL